MGNEQHEAAAGFDHGRAFWPEMGEQSPNCLFNTQYLYRGYSVYWKVENDERARAELKRLKVRPRAIERRTPADHSVAKRLGSDVFSTTVTSAAHSKLRDAGLCAITVLLD